MVQECYASIDVAMGGKAAEELIFGQNNVNFHTAIAALLGHVCC